MTSKKTQRITLRDDQADLIEELVRNGKYESADEVIYEALRLLQDQEHALNVWLKAVAVPAYQDLIAAPCSGLSIAQLRAALCLHRKVP